MRRIRTGAATATRDTSPCGEPKPPKRTISPAEKMRRGHAATRYTVGNGEFPRAVFGDEVTDARPVLVSFEGNPASVPAKVWLGRPWHGKPDASTRVCGLRHARSRPHIPADGVCVR